jgi:hypothetical protein
MATYDVQLDKTEHYVCMVATCEAQLDMAKCWVPVVATNEAQLDEAECWVCYIIPRRNICFKRLMIYYINS